MMWWRVEFTGEGGIKSCEQIEARLQNSRYSCFVQAKDKAAACGEAQIWLKKVAPRCADCCCIIPGLETVVATRAYRCKPCKEKYQTLISERDTRAAQQAASLEARKAAKEAEAAARSEIFRARSAAAAQREKERRAALGQRPAPLRPSPEPHPVPVPSAPARKPPERRNASEWRSPAAVKQAAVAAVKQQEVASRPKLDFTPKNVLAAFDSLGPEAFRAWLVSIS